jgi:hypothetical protein
MSQHPIVLINGLPYSGKGTIAKFLVREHGFTLHKIAKPIKDMLRALPGITEDHIEGHLKDVPTPLLAGRSPRWALQTLGKQWRDLMHPDLLCILWENGRPDGPLVVDDFRFPNEVPFFRQRGARSIRVVRPGLEAPDTGHEAEKQVLPVDAVITNDGAIEDLEVIAERCLLALGVPLGS